MTQHKKINYMTRVIRRYLWARSMHLQSRYRKSFQWNEFAVTKMVFVPGLGQAVAIDPRNRTC